MIGRFRLCTIVDYADIGGVAVLLLCTRDAVLYIAEIVKGVFFLDTSVFQALFRQKLPNFAVWSPLLLPVFLTLSRSEIGAESFGSHLSTCYFLSWTSFEALASSLYHII